VICHRIVLYCFSLLDKLTKRKLQSHSVQIAVPISLTVHNLHQKLELVRLY